MKKKIILIKSLCREYTYGVGSYINNIISGLHNKTDIEIYFFDVSQKNDIFSYKKSYNLTTVQIPFILSPKLMDEKGDSINRRSCKLIAEILTEKFHLRNSIIIINATHEYYLASALRKICGSKIVFVFHTATKENIFPFRLDFKEFISKIDHVVFPSKFCKQFICSNFSFVQTKSDIIYNGISLPILDDTIAKNNILSKYDISPNEKLILFVGRIDFQKGIKYLLESFNLLINSIQNHNLRLVLVGDGDIGSFLQYCKGIYSHVTFTGYLPHNEVCELYQISDIGILPSLNENCSYTALEMMSYKLPVIATDVGGFKEIFEHKKTGLLVPMKMENCKNIPSSDAIVECINELISNNELKQIIINNAYSILRRKYSSSAMASRYIRFLE